MKYCQKYAAARRQNADTKDAKPASAAAQSTAEPPVRRYVHPIHTAQSARRDPLEEVLADVLEALSRQTALLEELLRRTEDGGEGTKNP